MEEYMEKYLLNLLNLLKLAVEIAIVLFYMWGFKKFDDWRTPFDEDRLMQENENRAVAIRRSGFYIGFAIAVSGVMAGPSKGFILDVIGLLGDGFLSCIILCGAFMVNNFLMLKGVDNDKETGNGNEAVSIFTFGCFVATGLILNGSLTGEGGGWLEAFIFFVIGQAVLILMYYLFGWIEKIKIDSDPGGGIAMAGVMIAIGFILRASIAGPSKLFGLGLWEFAVSAVGGILLLILFKIAIAILFVPYLGKECGDGISERLKACRINLEAKGYNDAVQFIVASVRICLSIIISSVIT
jgi:uncharacterized membrane protein YjfL (UPF0719 family)